VVEELVQEESEEGLVGILIVDKLPEQLVGPSVRWLMSVHMVKMQEEHPDLECGPPPLELSVVKSPMWQ